LSVKFDLRAVLLTSIALVAVALSPARSAGTPKEPSLDQPNREATFLAAVQQFADNVLDSGRDVYGPKHTPLFVDGVNADTREPVTWRSPDGREWVLVNVASQQNLFRTLVGLTALTGESKYEQAAVDATRYTLDNLRYGGFISWGGHTAYDATADTVVYAEDKGQEHELKNHMPFYELLWQVDPAEAKGLIETMWNGHILDWSTLDFNRHGSPRPMGKLWDNDYKGGEVFFWGKGLTFLNAGSDLIYAAALLSQFSEDNQPLTWAKRLAHRYVETRNPKTGIGGYQFSQAASAWCTWDENGPIITGDRAEYQYGDDFPGHLVVEGTLFPCYGSTPEVAPWVSQFVLGESLGADGKEFIEWAHQELAAWARSAYRESDNSFIPMLTDGTSMEGYVCKKDGYFGPKGRVLKAGRARAEHLWAYTLAFRLTGDPLMWQMARKIAQRNGLGDIGETQVGQPDLNLETDSSEAAALLAFLELYRKTGQRAFLTLSERIGDNILSAHFHRGFFLESDSHVFAQFDRIEPLALLRLVAALRGVENAVPTYPGGRGFYASAYGDLGHRYDRFIYSQTRDEPGSSE